MTAAKGSQGLLHFKQNAGKHRDTAQSPKIVLGLHQGSGAWVNAVKVTGRWFWKGGGVIGYPSRTWPSGSIVEEPPRIQFAQVASLREEARDAFRE